MGQLAQPWLVNDYDPWRVGSTWHSRNKYPWRTFVVAILSVTFLLGLTILIGNSLKTSTFTPIATRSDASRTLTPDAVPTAPAKDPNSDGTTGSINTDSNVRGGPGTSYRVIAVLAANSQVAVRCRVEKDGDPWYELASPYPGDFVAVNLITLPAPAPIPPCATSG